MSRSLGSPIKLELLVCCARRLRLRINIGLETAVVLSFPWIGEFEEKYGL